MSWLGRVPWLEVYVGFSLSVEVFEQFLNILQLQRYKQQKQPPAAFQEKISAEEFEKTTAYNRECLALDAAASLAGSAANAVSSLCFLSPFLWRFSASAGAKGEYSQPLLFLACHKLISEFLSIPFQLYRDFGVEQRHGFNRKTLKLFFRDKCLSLALSAFLGAPIVSAVIFLVNWGGDAFYLWLWGFSVLTTFGMMVIYPNFIAPLFNKFQPLSDQQLRQKINALAEEVGFPLCEVYEVDGSKRSTHSNAYFFGFWKWKRIVIFDTLLHLPHEQILAVLGHELGHWQHQHLPQRLLLAFLNLFFVFYLLQKTKNNSILYSSFGFNKEEQHPVVGLLLLSNILAPINTLIAVVSTLLSRYHEFQADAFACSLGFGFELKKALFSIHSENKASLDPHPWYSWWHYSHPPLLERLSAIDAELKKEKNKTEKEIKKEE